MVTSRKCIKHFMKVCSSQEIFLSRFRMGRPEVAPSGDFYYCSPNGVSSDDC